MKKQRFTVEPPEEGLRLDHFLANHLELSRSKIRALILKGSVYVDARRTMIASILLKSHAAVELWIPTEKPRAEIPDLTEESVLFEDEYIILLAKPPGLPTQPTLDQARKTMYSEVQRLRPGYVGLHHRLDRDTSGVMLFTKSKAANKGVADLFSQHRIQKKYLALCSIDQKPRAKEFEISNFLKVTKLPGKKNRVIATRAGGDLAKTKVRILDQRDGLAEVEALPQTGRMHQIRVHLSDEDLPILGDDTYGSPESKRISEELGISRVMLHAVSLTFKHPISNVEYSVTGDPPEDFQKCLKRLQSRKGSPSS